MTPNNTFTMVQVPVKHGAEIECIKLEKAKVGVEYPKSFAKLFVNKPNKPKKECTCDQRKNKLPGASCEFSGACSDGCQWCPDNGSSCHCSSCCH